MKVVLLFLAIKFLWPPDIATATGAKCAASLVPKVRGCDSSKRECQSEVWKVRGYVRHGSDDGEPVMSEMVDSRKKAIDICSKFQNEFDKQYREAVAAK